MAPFVTIESHFEWMQVERRGRWGAEGSREPLDLHLQLAKLDLFNFDSAAAWDSPVVLTSPRSLAACRRAGVKPVELLYRSEQEVLASLPPDVPAGVLKAVHRRTEDERQAKLHACRAIRHQLVQQAGRCSPPRHGFSPDSPKRDQDGDRATVFPLDSLGGSTPSSALAAPLFPAKRDVLRVSSPDQPKSGADDSKLAMRASGRSTPDAARASADCRKDNKPSKAITFSAHCTPPSPPPPSRKELLDKENASRASHDEPRLDSRQGSIAESRLESKPGSRLDVSSGACPAGLGARARTRAISPNLSAATSPARSARSQRSQRSQRSTPSSDRPRTVLVDCWGQARSVPAHRLADTLPKPRRRPPRPASSGTLSSQSESRCSSRLRQRRRAVRPSRPPGSRLGARRSLFRGLRGSVRAGSAGSASTPCPSPRKAACLSPRKAASLSVQDCDSGRGSSTMHSAEQGHGGAHSLRLSRLETTTPSDLGSWMPGSALCLGLGLGEEVVVPEHDRRILESMAMKKQQERRDEEAAHRAHLQWEEELQRRRQTELARAAKWQATVNARRRWEAKENARRMEAVKHSLRLAQQRLEESIRLKEERVQLRVLEEDVQRMVLQGERSKEYAARRLEGEEKLLHIQEGERSYRRLLDEELRCRQVQADGRRRRATERERERAASANREWERCRLERASLLAVQAEESARLMRAAARERHQRAANNKGRIRRRRQQRALQASLEREAKHSDARAMHADLEHGLQLWRERCAALRESAALRAQERALEQREHVRNKLHRSNQRRRRQHRALHARVLAEEECRRRAQRGEIRDKDQRIRQLRRLKERAVEESREQAFVTASLREDLRRALSPETFDRKAARVQLELRVSTGRACASSLSPEPTNRSHIFLG